MPIDDLLPELEGPSPSGELSPETATLRPSKAR
jgi:hypothetical protein